MPYADREKQLAAMRERYAERLKSRAFQKKEAARKAEWLQTEDGARKNAEASARARKKKNAKDSQAKENRRLTRPS